MDGQRNLLIGFDLCNDYTQISCFNNNTFVPETIQFDYDSDNELIDTVMAVNNVTKEWLLGEDAIKAVKEEKAVLVSNIVENARCNKNIKIFDVELTPVEVLTKFFRKSLSLIKRYHPNESINKIIVTIERTDITLVQTIFEALAHLGMKRDRVSVQSHSQSFLYYAMSQKKELWMNDVALFHYGIKGLCYYQVSVDRKHRPITVGVAKKDYSDMLSYKMIREKTEEELKEVFDRVVTSSIYKQIISTVYLTGKGFTNKWIDSSLDVFGNGKRIFKGINLFSEGACYAARAVAEPEKFADYLFLSDDMVVTAISVNAYCEAKDQELIFVKTGTPWYEADKTYEFVLDNTNEVEIVVRDEFKNTKKSYIIALDFYTNRPNKTTRVKINVKYVNPKVCVVKINDLGFGEFYKSTYRVWEKVFDFN